MAHRKLPALVPDAPEVVAAEKTAGFVARNWKGIAAICSVLTAFGVWAWTQYTASAVKAAHSVDTRQSEDRDKMEARLTSKIDAVDNRTGKIEAKLDVLLQLQGVDPRRVAATP